MQRNNFFAEWSALHGGVEIKGIVKGWLTLSFFVARALNKFRITPNLLTLLGLLFAILTWPTAHQWIAPLWLALSLMCDGVDGSLALISSKSSKRGAMLDSIADRLSEVFWALAFYELGADSRIIFIAWLAAFTQEYLRARVAGVGAQEIGIVTIAERPVRASLLFIALIAAAVNLSWAPQVAIVWMAMQIIALATLTTHFYRRLK